MDGEPTEELDEITDEIPLAPELVGDPPMESERENNGPPMVWLGAALALLVGAVAVIFLIGQNRGQDDAADPSLTATSAAAATPDVTPPIGDPSAGAAGDDVATTADTSPPDEATPDPTPTPTSVDEAADDTAADDTSTTEVETSAAFIVGDEVATVGDDDFEIAVSTNVCTTIEWSFSGEGQSASYTSEQLCFNDHLLSPRPEHPLQPGTDYTVTAIFSAEGASEVVVYDITTTG